jgi:hypothetical protein
LFDRRAYVIINTGHKYSLKLVNQLYQAGIIEGYEKKGSYLFVRLSTSFSAGRLESFACISSDSISNMPTPRHGGTNYTMKNIQKYERVGGHHKMAFFNTDKGIITGSEASFKQTGGLPLFQIK